jgi:hypothetical protein
VCYILSLGRRLVANENEKILADPIVDAHELFRRVAAEEGDSFIRSGEILEPRFGLIEAHLRLRRAHPHNKKQTNDNPEFHSVLQLIPFKGKKKSIQGQRVCRM